MAAIAFNTHRAEHIWERINVAYRSMRQLLDACQLPHAVRCRRSRAGSSTAGSGRAADDRTMIAAQLADPNVSPRSQRRRFAAAQGSATEPPGGLPAGEIATPFRPLDPDTLSDAIPAFFIGRSREGFWVARDAKGRSGGLFLLERSAVLFARAQSEPTGCATIYPRERFELDLANQGNRFIPQIRWLVRLARRAQERIAAAFGNFARMVKRMRRSERRRQG